MQGPGRADYREGRARQQPDAGRWLYRAGTTAEAAEAAEAARAAGEARAAEAAGNLEDW